MLMQTIICQSCDKHTTMDQLIGWWGFGRGKKYNRLTIQPLTDPEVAAGAEIHICEKPECFVAYVEAYRTEIVMADVWYKEVEERAKHLATEGCGDPNCPRCGSGMGVVEVTGHNASELLRLLMRHLSGGG